MKDCIVTRHADRFVAECLASSVRLPWRFARSLLRTAAPRQKGNPTVRVSGTMLLLCRGARVLTVWQLALEDWVTVLVWVATGAWVGEEA